MANIKMSTAFWPICFTSFRFVQLEKDTTADELNILEDKNRPPSKNNLEVRY